MASLLVSLSSVSKEPLIWLTLTLRKTSYILSSRVLWLIETPSSLSHHWILAPVREGGGYSLVGVGCAARFFKSWPDFKPKHLIFHTRFQTRTSKIHARFQIWPLGRNYLLRYERKQEKHSIPFRIRIVLFLSYWFGIETINAFIRSVVPSKTIPDSRPKWAKSIPVIRPKRLKNPTRWGGTYLYGFYKVVPPGLWPKRCRPVADTKARPSDPTTCEGKISRTQGMSQERSKEKKRKKQITNKTNKRTATETKRKGCSVQWAISQVFIARWAIYRINMRFLRWL